MLQKKTKGNGVTQMDFNLSNHIFSEGYIEDVLDVECVKEFIRLLKEEMFYLFGHEPGVPMEEIDLRINKLAGDKLI